MESKPVGTVQGFIIKAETTGGQKYFKHFDFPKSTLTMLEIVCGDHVRKVELADLDLDLPPEDVNDQALDAPYAYIAKDSDQDHFKAEIAFFPKNAQRLICTHSGPDNQKNTTSLIAAAPQDPLTSELLKQNTFHVVNFATDQVGAHVVTDGKRKSKTKNKNHSPTPPPKDLHSNTTVKGSGSAKKNKQAKTANIPQSSTSVESPKAKLTGISKPK